MKQHFLELAVALSLCDALIRRLELVLKLLYGALLSKDKPVGKPCALDAAFVPAPRIRSTRGSARRGAMIGIQYQLINVRLTGLTIIDQAACAPEPQAY